MATPQQVELRTEMLLRVRDLTKSGLSSFADNARNAADSVTGIKKAMDGIGGIAIGNLFGGLGINAVTGAISGIKNLGEALIANNSQMQQIHATFQTLYSGNSGDADQAINYLNQFALKAPFTRQAVYEAGTQIASIGGNITQVMPDLGNLASAMHTTLPIAAQSLTDAFEGRFYMMQRDLHVTKQQLQGFGLEVDNTGHVVQSTLLPAIHAYVAATGMAGGGGNMSAMTRQLGTFQGGMSNLTDSLQQATIKLGAPLFAVVTHNIGAFVKIIRDAFLGNGGGANNAITRFVASAGAELAKFGVFIFAVIRLAASEIPKIIEFFKAGFAKVSPIFDALVSHVNQAVKMIQGIFASMGSNALVGMLTRIGAMAAVAIGGIVFAITRFLVIWSVMGAAIQALMPIILPVFNAIQQVSQKVLTLVITNITAFGKSIKSAFSGINANQLKSVFSGISAGIIPAIEHIVSIIRSSITAVIPVFKKIGGAVAEVGQNLYTKLRPPIIEVFGLLMKSIHSIIGVMQSFNSGSLSGVVSAFKALAIAAGGGLVVALNAISGILILVQHNAAILGVGAVALAIIFRTKIASSFSAASGGMFKWIQSMKDSKAAAEAVKASQESLIGLTQVEVAERVKGAQAVVAATEKEITALGRDDAAKKKSMESTLKAQQNNLAYIKTIQDGVAAKNKDIDATNAAIRANNMLNIEMQAVAQQAFNLAMSQGKMRVATILAAEAAGTLTREQAALLIATEEVGMATEAANLEAMQAIPLQAENAVAKVGLTTGTWALVTATLAQAAATLLAMAPMVLIGLAIGGLALLYKAHAKQIDAIVEKIKHALTPAFNAVKAVLASVASFIGGVLMGAWNALVSALSSLVSPLEAAGKAIKDGLGAALDWLGNQIIPPVMNWIHELQGAFQGASNGSATSASSISSAWGTVKGVFSSVYNFIKPVISGITSFIGSHMDMVKSIVSGMVDMVKGNFEMLWNFIKIPIDLIVDLITNKGFGKIKKDVLADMGGMIKGLIDILTGVVKTIGPIMLPLINAFIFLANKIKSALATGLTYVASFVGQVAGLFARLGVMIKEGLTSAIEGGLNDLIDKVNGFTGKFGWVPGLSGHTNISKFKGVETAGQIGNDATRASNQASQWTTSMITSLGNTIGKQIKPLSEADIDKMVKGLSTGAKAGVDKIFGTQSYGGGSGGGSGGVLAQSISDVMKSVKMNLSDPAMTLLMNQYTQESNLYTEQKRNGASLKQQDITRQEMKNTLTSLYGVNYQDTSIQRDTLQLAKARDPKEINTILAQMRASDDKKLAAAQAIDNKVALSGVSNSINAQVNGLQLIQKDGNSITKQMNDLIHTADYDPTKASTMLSKLQAGIWSKQAQADWAKKIANLDPRDAHVAEQLKRDEIKAAVYAVKSAIDKQTGVIAAAGTYNPNQDQTHTVQQIDAGNKKRLAELFKDYTNKENKYQSELKHKDVKPADKLAAEAAKQVYLSQAALFAKFDKDFGVKNSAFSKFMQASTPPPIPPPNTGTNPNNADNATKVGTDIKEAAKALKDVVGAAKAQFTKDLGNNAPIGTLKADLDALHKALVAYAEYGKKNLTSKQIAKDNLVASQTTDILGMKAFHAMLARLHDDIQAKKSPQQLAQDEYNVQQAGLLGGQAPGTTNTKLEGIMYAYYKSGIQDKKNQLKTDEHNNLGPQVILNDIAAVLKQMKLAHESKSTIDAAQISMDDTYYKQSLTLAEAKLKNDERYHNDHKTIWSDTNTILSLMKKLQDGKYAINNKRTAIEDTFYKGQLADEKSILLSLEKSGSGDPKSIKAIIDAIAATERHIGGAKYNPWAVTQDTKANTEEYYQKYVIDAKEDPKFQADLIKGNFKDAFAIIGQIGKDIKQTGGGDDKHSLTMAKMNKEYYGAKVVFDENKLLWDQNNGANQQKLDQDRNAILKDASKMNSYHLGSLASTINKRIFAPIIKNDKAVVANDIAGNVPLAVSLKDIAVTIADMKAAGNSVYSKTAIINTNNGLVKQLFDHMATQDKKNYASDIANGISPAQAAADIAKIMADYIDRNKYSEYPKGGKKVYSDAQITAERNALNKEYYAPQQAAATTQFKLDLGNNDFISSLKDIKVIIADMKAAQGSNASSQKDYNARMLLQQQLTNQLYTKKLTQDQAQFSTDVTNNATYTTLMTDLNAMIQDMQKKGDSVSEIQKAMDAAQKQIDVAAKANLTAFDFGKNIIAPPATKGASFGGVDLSFGMSGGGTQMQIIRRLEDQLAQQRQQNLNLEEVIAKLSNQDTSMKGIKIAVEKQNGIAATDPGGNFANLTQAVNNTGVVIVNAITGNKSFSTTPAQRNRAQGGGGGGPR